MMRVTGTWPKVLIFVGIVLVYQVLVHLALTRGAPEPLRIALLVLPLAVVAGWVLLRSTHRLLWAAILVATGIALGMVAQREWRAALYGLPHAAAYLFLLWLFGRTLLPGREALITRLARTARGGTLPPEMLGYTRGATVCWCIFFAAQLAGSALLLGFGALEWWSFFVNLLNLPLLALMFAAEYLYRVLRFPGTPQASIATAVETYARDRLTSQRAR